MHRKTTRRRLSAWDPDTTNRARRPIFERQTFTRLNSAMLFVTSLSPRLARETPESERAVHVAELSLRDLLIW